MCKPIKEFRITLRKLKGKPQDAEIRISVADTIKAIKKAKNLKALGPDKISTVMLKHLGNTGLKILINLHNNIFNQAIIPATWKVRRIILLLKPAN